MTRREWNRSKAAGICPADLTVWRAWLPNFPSSIACGGATRSEARSHCKQRLKMSRLPPGTRLERLA